mmetsp:Transcript_1390/g.5387  ORF Transcript_1390/g.5387 Transcript_1390/m.5387 type:complete len:360 (-) Transcript_1390:593-1672(-)
MANGGQHHEFIEFVCKPIEDLYISTNERRTVRIPAGTEYRCSMLREQHFSSLFRHYGKHNGVDKETLVFFFTEELMRELEPNDTPKSVHLKKNDVIVIRHRRKPQPDGLCVRLDLTAPDALELIRVFPRARSLQSSDGRAALHHVAARAGQSGDVARDLELATDLLLLGCDPRTLDNYGRTAADVARQHHQRELAALLAPNEFKKQMAVVRAHFLGTAAYSGTLPSQKAAFAKLLADGAVAAGSDAGGPHSGGPDAAADMDADPSMPPHLLSQQRFAVGAEARARHAPPDMMLLKRPCPSKDDDDKMSCSSTGGGASGSGRPEPSDEEKYHGAVRFLFSALAHGNQARNFKRVVCFLYA